MQKPIYISGHWRNRRIPAQAPKINTGAVLVAATIILLLAVYWQFTVTVALGTSLATFAHKYHKFLNDPSRLVVNRFDAGPVDNVWNNIKGMVQEG